MIKGKFIALKIYTNVSEPTECKIARVNEPQYKLRILGNDDVSMKNIQLMR